MKIEERAELYRQTFCQAHDDAGKAEIDAMVSCLADDFKIVAKEAEAAMRERCLLAVKAAVSEDPTARDYVAGLAAAEQAILALE